MEGNITWSIQGGYYMKRFIFLLAAICILLSGCSASCELKEVTAVVVCKHHEDSWLFFNPAFKTFQTMPEKNEVTVRYGEIQSIIDNKELYNSVEEGDYTQVLLRTDYSKSGKIIYQKLYLLE